MLRINYKREKMKRPYPKASHESRFYLQKQTLGTMGTLHKQINCGELPYISMRMSKRLSGEIQTPQSPPYKAVLFSIRKKYIESLHEVDEMVFLCLGICRY